MTTQAIPTDVNAALDTLERNLDDLSGQLKNVQALTAAIRGDIRGRPEPVQRDLLTVEEVAERLSLGLNSVYNLIRQGDLGSVKIGRARRVPARAVEAFLEHLAEVGEVDI